MIALPMPLLLGVPLVPALTSVVDVAVAVGLERGDAMVACGAPEQE